MALDKFFSMFSGQFDCAMRDRSGGLCGGVRQKTSSKMDAPLDATAQLQRLVHQKPHVAEAIYQQSRRPEVMNQMLMDNQMQINQMLMFPDQTDVVKVPVGYDSRFDPPYGGHDQSLYRLPSPGLSARDLPTHSRHTEMNPETEREYLALKALFYYQEKTHELVLGTSVDSADNMQDTGFPGELPCDFYHKLADLVARDRQVQERIATGDVQFCGRHTLRSRFLQECIRDRAELASQLWRALDVCDKQDFLLAYSCGPPSPDFFVNLMMPRYSPSECGSSSTDFDVRSTEYSPSECGSSSNK
jgi:hypothetical protein